MLCVTSTVRDGTYPTFARVLTEIVGIYLGLLPIKTWLLIYEINGKLSFILSLL